MEKIIKKLKQKYKNSLFDNGVTIFTHFPKTKKLDKKLSLNNGTVNFIKNYLGCTHKNEIRLYPHQWNMLNAYSNNGINNFILTSSTGSGKSLVFWTWVIDRLLLDKKATALLCFPTQALMWGQAERLAQISSSIKTYSPTGEIGWSGSLGLGRSNNDISWTVWKGTNKDKEMKEHEKSSEFKIARIRLATVDKAHWSLIRSHVDFTKNLNCVVLDEAHQYDSIFGANVNHFLKRLYIAKEGAKKDKPNIFLASATLSDAKPFAAKLTSFDEDDIYHVGDASKVEIKTVSQNVAKNILKAPYKYYKNRSGLLRIAFFIDSSEKRNRLSELLTDTKIIGNKLNIIYFAESKYQSNLQVRKSNTDNRKTIVYHGDIPPLQRRQIERQFNDDRLEGINLLATNALELGVDIEGLDICLIDDLPPKRTAFLQRIGRVGRRQDKPGIILINLSANPFDRQIANNLESVFKFDNSRTIPIPENLEMLRFRHMIAAHYEGCYRNYAKKSGWESYKNLFEINFGEFFDKDEAIERLKDRYPKIFDIRGTFWVHKGFRGSIGEGKIPLRKIGTNKEVARIEDIYIYRDAHPGAIYLNYEGRSWQIQSYSGNWGESIWEHPDSDYVIGKFFKDINVINVKESKGNIVTRGMWNETFTLYQVFNDAIDDLNIPTSVEIEYGIWEYNKKFNGYKEIELSTGKSKIVTMKQITKNFKNAINSGTDFPFLPSLSYRTYGWEWKFDDAFEEWDENDLKSIESIVSNILEPYFADIVQANPSDLTIKISLSKKYLRILDTSPGGNGLSEVLLINDNLYSAFTNCLDVLSEYENKTKQFNLFVIQICREETDYEAEEIIQIIEELQSYWER